MTLILSPGLMPCARSTITWPSMSGASHLLRAIARLGPVGVSALAEDQELDRTTLTRNLALLERDGLIEQSPGIDKRTSLAQLTRAGSATIARALPHWERVQDELRHSLGAQTLAQLGEIHEKISAAAKTGLA